MSPPPRRYVHVDYPPAPRGPPPRSPPYYYPPGDRGRSPPRGWPSPPRNFGEPRPDRGPFRRDPRDLPPPPGRQIDWERTADMRHHPSSLEPRLHPSNYMERAPYGRERRLSPPPPPQWRPRELPPARSSPRRRDSPLRRIRAASLRSASPAFLDSRLSPRPERSAAARRGDAERHERSRLDSPGRLATRREQAERSTEPRAAAAQPGSAADLKRAPGRDAERHEQSKRDSLSRLAPRREPVERKPEPRDSPSRLAPRREPAESKPEPRGAAAQPSSLQVSSSNPKPESARRHKEDMHSEPGRAEKDGSSRSVLVLSEHKAADGAWAASEGRSASKEAGAEQAGVPSRAGPLHADGPKTEERKPREGQHEAHQSPTANVKADREAASRRDPGQESSVMKKRGEGDTGTAAQHDKKPRTSTAAPVRSGRASDAEADRQPSAGIAATPSQKHPSQEHAHRSHDARKAGSSAAASREYSGAARREAPRSPVAKLPGHAGPVSPTGTWGRYSATAGNSASAAAPSSAAPTDLQPKSPEEKGPDASAAGKDRGCDSSIPSPRDSKPKDGAAGTRKGQEGASKDEGKPLADRGAALPHGFLFFHDGRIMQAVVS